MTRRRARRNRAVAAALVTNLVVAIAKLAGFALTRSATMLAAGIGSATDAGHQALLLMGGRRARRGAPEHPFGYGRERYFWSFVVAIVALTLAATFAVLQGVARIDHPRELDSPEVAIGILAGALLVQCASLAATVREAKATKGRSTSYRRFMRTSKVPELPAALLQGTAGLAGLVLALAALTTALVTGDPVWDAYGSLAIGALMAMSAVGVAGQMRALLVGASATRHEVEMIRAAIEIEPGVVGLIHMRTEHVGPDELVACAKVEFDHHLTLPEVTAAMDRVERNVRANVASARVMYIEPTVAWHHRADPVVPEHHSLDEMSAELRALVDAERQAAENPRLPPAR